jgi:hypothetical protein
VAGCGQSPGDAPVPTTPPAAFVEGVRELVEPAERMGVLATAVLKPGGPQPSSIEVDGVVADAARELREFRALRPGDPALVTEQARLADAMAPIVARMRELRTIITSGSRAGLSTATTSLLEALEEIPSAVRS